MAGKPFFLRVLRVVSESALDADARHIVMVMATYAQSTSGIGLHSQKTIARLTGRSERHVRAVLAALADPLSTPVRIERRARFRPDGRGRTSDEWTLILVRDQPASGAVYSTDQPAPGAGETPGLTGTPCTTNRHGVHDQPAPRAADLRSDRRSDRRSRSASTSDAGSFALPSLSKDQSVPNEKPRRRKPSKRAKSVDPEHGDQHARVVAFYIETFEAKRGEKPVFDSRDGADVDKLLEKCGGDVEKACRAITGAFVSWKADTVTIRQIASNPSEFIGAKPQKANGRAAPQQANADDVAAVLARRRQQQEQSS